MLFTIDHLSLKPQKELHLKKMYPFLQQRNFKQNKSHKFISSTTRFLKNKNIVQSNKQNLQYLKHSSTFRPYSSEPFNPYNLPKRSAPSSKNQARFQRISSNNQQKMIRSTQRFSFNPNKSCVFTPKIKEGIIQKYRDTKNIKNSNVQSQAKQTKLNLNNQQKNTLSKLLIKNQLYSERCLVGKNIPKIQESYSFSRFQLFGMYTYFNTLVQSSKSIDEMRKGFQSVLYINKIELNSDMIDQMFIEFSKKITFSNFIRVYGNIQNLLFTQNIIEYIKEVFKLFYREEMIGPQRILQTLKNKMQEGDSCEIMKMIYLQLNLNQQEDQISVKLIIKACQQNFLLSKRIFNSMNKIPANANRPVKG